MAAEPRFIHSIEGFHGFTDHQRSCAGDSTSTAFRHSGTTDTIAMQQTFAKTIVGPSLTCSTSSDYM